MKGRCFFKGLAREPEHREGETACCMIREGCTGDTTGLSGLPKPWPAECGMRYRQLSVYENKESQVLVKRYILERKPLHIIRPP